MTRLSAKAGLSLERLRTFVEIVVAKGISNAAPGDPTRQSQFSRQLKELEEVFGAELLVRGRGRFALTAAGRELFAIVQSHFAAMQELADRCADAAAEVNVGAGESLLQWLFLPCLAELRARLPAVAFVLHNLQTEEIITRLRDGRLDAGLMRQDAVAPPLAWARLGVVEYRLAVPKSRGKADVWSALARHPVAVLAGGGITAALESVAAKKRVRLDVCLRGSSYAQLVEAARQLGCAAVLPSFAVEALGGGFEALSLPALKSFTRAIALAWNPRACMLRPAVAGAVEAMAGILRSKFG
jgi:DNA-binding transcriptional LysR family regulator